MNINISSVNTANRVRKDMGSIDELANSIKEHGQGELRLIEPIILAHENGAYSLLAGGRRLAALKRLGLKELVHEVHYLLREEVDELLAKSIELEENLRRQDLTWQEQLAAKEQLFRIMEAKHGRALSGRAAEQAKKHGESTGFGVRALAAMLNESPATVSQDLELARHVAKMPALLNAPTKESARRKLSTGVLMLGMMKLARSKAATSAKLWTLYEGDFRDNISQVPSASVDLIYTDLPYGVGLTTFSKHNTAVAQYKDTRDSVVSSLADLFRESRRVLQDNRFGVVWFGFNYYCDLLGAIAAEGLGYHPVPIVWYKHTNSCENPHIYYGSSYDAAILFWKGDARFIRQGQSNFVSIPAVQGKLQIAQQPVALVTKFLDDTTIPGATVLDFCAGSGTTGEACVRSKRHVILFEKDLNICQIIKARLGAI